MSDTQADIQLFNETNLELPFSSSHLKHITHLIEEGESVTYAFLEFVFVDEDKIVEINKEHLNRDYITDTISFNYNEENPKNDIEGTLFLCAPRIKEQSMELGQDTDSEFYRVIIHSLLHLAGYQDSDESDKKVMTEKENNYLALMEK